MNHEDNYHAIQKAQDELGRLVQTQPKYQLQVSELHIQKKQTEQKLVEICNEKREIRKT